jgi:hypothetical protein
LQVHEVYTLGLGIWRDLVYSAIKDRLLCRIVDVVRADRNGERVDVNVVKVTVDSLVMMGVVNKTKPLEL